MPSVIEVRSKRVAGPNKEGDGLGIFVNAMDYCKREL